MNKEKQLKELRTIPGVGKSIAVDLWNLGIRKVEDLKGRSPEKMYEQSNKLAGMGQDPCLMYVFRCAVYFAETDEKDRESEKLKWWNWKEKKQSFILIVFLIILADFTFAQDEYSLKIADTMTIEQIIREYESWSGIKDDWPNLAYYRDANSKLRPPAEGENRVVFMGNSITEGWLYANPEFFEGKPYINRGISGQTTPQMLIRFRPDVIDLRPEIVVLLCGVNDIAQNTGPSTLEMIESNIASMAELAKANGIKPILCSVLPAADFPWRPGLEPSEKIVALNHWIKAFAAKNKFIYLDYFTSMADENNGMKSEYSDDGVHPNKAGYQVMEKLLEKTLTSIIK